MNETMLLGAETEPPFMLEMTKNNANQTTSDILKCDKILQTVVYGLTSIVYKTTMESETTHTIQIDIKTPENSNFDNKHDNVKIVKIQYDLTPIFTDGAILVPELTALAIVDSKKNEIWKHGNNTNDSTNINPYSKRRLETGVINKGIYKTEKYSHIFC